MVGTFTALRARARNILAIVATMAIAFAVGCGSDDGSSPFSINPGPHVVRADDTFTKESFISAGWKEYEPFLEGENYGATTAWLGFFNQKDIYLLFYETNEGATDIGKPIVLERLEEFRSDTVPIYYDYLIVGNVVVVCELEIAVCTAMADEL